MSPRYQCPDQVEAYVIDYGTEAILFNDKTFCPHDRVDYGNTTMTSMTTGRLAPSQLREWESSEDR